MANRNPLTHARLPGWLHDNLSILSATAFLTGIHSNMVSVVWQPYVLSLGASMTTLGWLTSLGGFQGIVTSLVQPIGGWLAEWGASHSSCGRVWCSSPPTRFTRWPG